jgi:hypothetical protein
MGELGQEFYSAIKSKLEVDGPRLLVSSLEGYNDAGKELAYTEFTSDVTVSGSEATPTDVVSATVVLEKDTPVLVEFRAYSMATSASAGDFVVISLWDGSTDLGRWAIALTPAAAVMHVPVHAVRKIATPDAGSHTYKACAWKGTNNGTIRATGTLPGFIRISKAS